MAQPLLSNGEVTIDNRDSDIADLRDEVERLEGENRRLRQELIRAKADSEGAVLAITALRGQLEPLYRALRAVFGEINLVVEESPISAPQRNAGAPGAQPIAPQFDPKWDMWKQKLGIGTIGERIITAILSCGPLNRNQLREQTSSGWSTLDTGIAKLKNLDLLERSGDKYNLK